MPRDTPDWTKITRALEDIGDQLKATKIVSEKHLKLAERIARGDFEDRVTFRSGDGSFVGQFEPGDVIDPEALVELSDDAEVVTYLGGVREVVGKVASVSNTTEGLFATFELDMNHPWVKLMFAGTQDSQGPYSIHTKGAPDG